MKAANAASFVLEVAFVCSVILWAIDVPGLSPLVATLAAGIPALVVTAVFLSAQSKWRLLWPLRGVVAHLLYLGGAIVLIVLGYLTLGWIFVLLVLLSAVLNWRLRRGFAAQDADIAASRSRARERRQARRTGATGRRAAR
ncbi:DUF2568 domain-containing protein [Zhihengliuella sp.]|uniref:DUF2568 domain-containing protein n=1 Tax=Zhihengliuella sp. TaxID=1954483 RepID=UPI0028116B4B|nr:DUF2568 domain-containing protein [Zhihengliuella sp.]